MTARAKTVQMVTAVDTAGGQKVLAIKKMAGVPVGLHVLDCRELGTPGSEWSLTHEITGKAVGVWPTLKAMKPFLASGVLDVFDWTLPIPGDTPGITVQSALEVIRALAESGGHLGAKQQKEVQND